MTAFDAIFYSILEREPPTILIPFEIEGEFCEVANSYLATLTSTNVKTLADIIQFNKDLPGIQAGIDNSFSY